MSRTKELINFVSDSISAFEVKLNDSIKSCVKDTFGLDPTEVEFRGGLFEAGFGGYRSEVEIRLTFTLPIQFQNWDDFADWHDSDSSNEDLDNWGFGELIDSSIRHNIHMSRTPFVDKYNSDRYDTSISRTTSIDKYNSDSKILLAIDISESSINFRGA